VTAPAAVGVDAHSKGWVAVRLRGGAFDAAWSAPDLATLLAGVSADDVIGVDIPIGGVPTGWRAADREARRLLGRHGARVFEVPPHPVWSAGSFAEAKSRCVQLTGRSLTIYAYGLLVKMRQADQHPGVLHEVHPELVFATLAGAPLAASKKTWNGQARRRRLLADAGIELPDDLGTAGRAGADDVLDAAAVAWCAHRIGVRKAAHLPADHDQLDHRGRPIRIWY
jgi:predicted RNase H-like nuclease